uniref:Uncharacterized protein n=1 Tax=Periophthalmus magnuspinnatus TaxID=409849 RepID=A0A3B4A6E3_9GOBI
IDSIHNAGLLRSFTMKARSTVRDNDPQDDLVYLRICTKIHEIMIAPEQNIQNPSSITTDQWKIT